MNKEAQEVFAKKQAELDAYAATVSEAETILKQLQKEVEEKREELAALKSSEENSNYENHELIKELIELDEKHQKEIEKMQLKHKQEVESLHADFAQTLQEAEQWANKHSEVALQEKINELNELKEQAQTFKLQLNELTYTQTRSRTAKIVDEVQRKSSDQITQLEAQISELTAITREEMRDARAKIDECVAAVEIRRENHAAELRRLENEANQRSERYAAHIQALKEQFDLEKATLQQSIDSINARSENTENIINQLGKHHEAQLFAVNNDIDTMRKSLSSPKTKTRNSLDAVRNSLRESKRLAVECNNIDEEIKMIDNEIFQLEDENKDLRKELKRLSLRVNRSIF
ncbi:hypothetical protein TRFO_12322 [Tritrichomonas foetus]|uniref:Kinetoplast-associated protein n=1 Tax=Tritrichomonas foetus TaxID=1144522 RepID=A0A1J4IZC7_9EUKA|nr:hypothetical protein TRFO_12322 [Tritrichomonas foetus]|eukprot:OHS92766.1 hypothetical protein TRFO_12322 [Tritrichomonas foetus]